jgi:hypothetical protein
MIQTGIDNRHRLEELFLKLSEFDATALGSARLLSITVPDS